MAAKLNVCHTMSEAAGPNCLTTREREILSLVKRGYRKRQIAQRLSISEDHLKRHLQDLYDKLGVTDLLGLAVYAARHKL